MVRPESWKQMRVQPLRLRWTAVEAAAYIKQCVLGGSFIEPTPVKPGPALSSYVTPRKGKAEFERRSP